MDLRSKLLLFSSSFTAVYNFRWSVVVACAPEVVNVILKDTAVLPKPAKGKNGPFSQSEHTE